jgi:hypothetical protein
MIKYLVYLSVQLFRLKAVRLKVGGIRHNRMIPENQMISG